MDKRYSEDRSEIFVIKELLSCTLVIRPLCKHTLNCMCLRYLVNVVLHFDSTIA
jgi:hypothetical protein